MSATYELSRPVINGRQSLIWYIVWTEPGRRSRRASTGLSDRRQAEGYLARWIAAQTSRPPALVTCSQLSAAYLAERIEARIAAPDELAKCLRHTDAFFGDLTPDLINRRTVRTYVARRRKAGVVNATIDKELRIFRQTLKFGVREGWTTDEPHIETPGGSAPRRRFLARSEFAAVYFWASPLHLRVFLALAIDTLARGKHILALRWDQVDFDRRIIWYAPHDPRSNKHVVAAPMSARLEVLLRLAREAALTDRVIEWDGKPVTSIRRSYGRACRLAQVDNAHKHDLRRSGASWAIQDGQSFDAVAALLGDSVETTRKVYAVFSPTYLRGVVESIGSGKGGHHA